MDQAAVEQWAAVGQVAAEQSAAAAEAGPSAIVSLFWVALAAVLAPLLARLLRDYVPGVVFLLVFGMLIGPSVAGLASESGGVSLLSELGLGMLFLLAGYELDPALLRGRVGRVTSLTWLVCLAIALGLVSAAAWAVLDRTPDAYSIIAVAIAATSTTLGTLLPIVKADGLLEAPLGRAVMAHGAVGELGPVAAMSILLTGRNPGAATVVLALFVVAALLIALVPARLARRIPGARGILDTMAGGTEQLPVRMVILLLVVLMAVADRFGLDVVLGAFAAGLILRRFTGGDSTRVDEPLEAIGYGVLIPVFFVVSGMGIAPAGVAGMPLVWAAFVLTILVARGLPVWLSDRLLEHDVSVAGARERAQLALYSAAGLPIIVAVTEVATRTDLMRDDLGATLVAAGATTVLLFPLAARIIGGGAPAARDGAAREGVTRDRAARDGSVRDGPAPEEAP